MKQALALAAGICILVTSASAQEEPILNVYNWSNYIAEDTVTKFEAETGVTVNYDVFDSNELLEAKLLAGKSGYDVVVPSGFFLERQIQAGLFLPLDKSKLPNLANMDPKQMEVAATHDPGNAYAIPYMSFTTGIGYNVDKVKERLGDVPVDSWDLVFKPEVASKIADCGLTLLDAPSEVVATALNYLGLDPNSESPDDLKKAEDLLTAARPYVRYFHSSQYINDLANGEVCVSIGYSGDVFIAKDNADQAENGNNIAYTIPKEGALSSFDMMAIPADAPHPDNAHKFINFIMNPEIVAAISNTVFYANPNSAATPFVDEAIRNNPGIYPPDETRAKAFALKSHSPSFDRLLTRAWTRIRTGQ